MENKKVSMSDVIAFTIAILIIFTTMFNNEIRNLLLSDWKTVMFFIGILLLIYSVLSFSMRIICRNIIKSQFNDIVSLNKRVIETEDYKNPVKSGITALKNKFTKSTRFLSTILTNNIL